MVPCVDGALILLKADYRADAERLRLQAMSTIRRWCSRFFGSPRTLELSKGRVAQCTRAAGEVREI